MKELLNRISNDIRKDLSKIDNKLSIVRIIPVLENNAVDTLIHIGYSQTLYKICEDLGINVYEEYINSSPYNLYNDAREYITKYNIRTDVTGIMYDSPFINDKFENTINTLIYTNKDIECLTPINIGKYLTKQQYETIPPLQSSVDMLIHEYIKCDLLRIGIIHSISNFNNVFNPVSNVDNNTYIISTVKDDTFIDLDMASLDVIISCMYDTYRRIDDTTMCWSDNIHAKLVIDYGWRTTSCVPSIDNNIFNDYTTHLTLYNGLMDLYIYNVIKNMIRLYKKTL